MGVVERGVVVVKRRVFPPLLCAIVSCVIPWRRFVSPFRFAVQYIVSSPSRKCTIYTLFLFGTRILANLTMTNGEGKSWLRSIPTT